MIQAETLNLLEWHRLCQHLATFTSTKQGARAAAALEIPETPEETRDLLRQTKEVCDLESRSLQGLAFTGIEDIEEALQRASYGGMLSALELSQVATTLAGARQLRRAVEAQESLPVLSAMVASLRTYPEVEQEIHHCIDEGGQIADRASVKLGEIRQRQRQVREQIYDKLNRIKSRLASALQEQLITQRGDRFVLPVKATHKDAIPGIVHDASATGATLYVEPNSVVAANNQARQLVRQEKTEEEAILRRLTEQVAAIAEDVWHLLEVATALDLATARSRYGLWLEGQPPEVFAEEWATHQELAEKTQSLQLRQLRHPLLVWQQRHEQGREVVSVDIRVQPPLRVVTITGPNTGGKTVTLKSLGLAALMAKAGMFVAAKEPVVLPWFDAVLADIGDEQSIEQNLSTFSGHVRRIGRILDAMTADSLILLDEVGAGTDPSEGSALAIALLQHFANAGRLTVATTHFGELKALKYQDERFENAAMEFDEVSLQPTYRLLWGIPGRSMALAIAHRLGLLSEIVEVAKTLVGAGTSEDVNQVIAGLEAQRQQQEAKAQEARELLRQTEALHQELLQKSAALKEREERLRQEQEAAVREAIAQAKEEIARAIRKLQQGNVVAQNTRDATDAVDRITEKYLPSKTAKPAPPEFAPKVGDMVRLPTGQAGEVLSLDEQKGQVTVKFGIMKLTIALSEIESLDGRKPRNPNPPTPVKREEKAPQHIPMEAPSVRTSKNTLDLRGQRVEAALVEIDRAIASWAGGKLWIVHGKGTGKLRQGVHEFLDAHPQVSHFELASQAEGGVGVTIATLK